MALVTFVDSTTIAAADLNNNFQDQDNAAASALQSKYLQQNYTVDATDLSSATPQGERSTIIRPSTYLRIYDRRLYIDDAAATTPASVSVVVECLTDSRLYDVAELSESVSAGLTTPAKELLFSPLESQNNAVLLPGFEYRLSLVNFTATPVDYARFTLVCYGLKGLT
jgi:hypothetical protein